MKYPKPKPKPKPKKVKPKKGKKKLAPASGSRLTSSNATAANAVSTPYTRSSSRYSIKLETTWERPYELTQASGVDLNTATTTGRLVALRTPCICPMVMTS